MDFDKHDNEECLHIRIDGMDQLIILLEQINNNVMLGLQNDKAILDAIAQQGIDAAAVAANLALSTADRQKAESINTAPPVPPVPPTS